MDCKDCVHSFVCWKSMQVEKDNLACSDFADRSLYVVREKGEWKNAGKNKGYICSNCGSKCLLNYESDWHESNFCPHCGAYMRKEAAE